MVSRPCEDRRECTAWHVGERGRLWDWPSWTHFLRQVRGLRWTSKMNPDLGNKNCVRPRRSSGIAGPLAFGISGFISRLRYRSRVMRGVTPWFKFRSSPCWLVIFHNKNQASAVSGSSYGPRPRDRLPRAQCASPYPFHLERFGRVVIVVQDCGRAGT